MQENRNKLQMISFPLLEAQMADPNARHKLEQQKLEEQAAADKATASAS